MKRSTQSGNPRCALLLVVCFAFLSVPVPGAAQAADCKEVFISEYMDGTEKNKVLELFNPTDQPIDLLGYSVLVYYDGSTLPEGIHLTGTVPAKGVYVLAYDQAEAAVLAIADQVSGDFHPDGNDAVELLKQNVLLDAIGVPGEDPGPGGWAVVGGGSTNDHTLTRQIRVKHGETNWALGQGQWVTHADRPTEGLGDHLSICRNAGGYTVEVIQGLAASYPEDYCTGTPCIEIVVQVTPAVSSPDNVYVEIDENTVCPLGDRTTPGDDNTFTNNITLLHFYDGGPNTQAFDLHIEDDALDEMNENLCLLVDATPNTCVNCVLNTVIIDNDVVGIKDLMAETGLEISPNPAAEILRLRNLTKLQNIEIVSIHGQRILPEYSTSAQEVEIMVSKLPTGMYFLQFEYRGQKYAHKFLKE